MIQLYDTARRSIVPFAPERVVRMYVCGITPYDSTHLGHAATYLTYDVLIRRLEELGHEVDVLFTYRPWPAFAMSAGYSLLVLGQGAKDAMTAEQRTSKGVPPDLSHYAFLQLTLNVPARP